jgi:flagellar hook protein FlgE
MLRSLNSGVSALQQFQGALDVIGNNVANSNTTGFKSARVDFADALSQTLQGSSPGSIQIGTGVLTDSISNQFIQGAINRTNSFTDLAISGNGFFVARNASTGAQFVTRAGDFQLDSSGYLVTASGLRVQGYSDAALTTLGDIRVDNTGGGLVQFRQQRDSDRASDGWHRVHARAGIASEFPQSAGVAQGG